MKKRLLSLLVALCMAVTLLPVSAITAWAEESGSTLKPLQIWSGYPVLDGITPTTDSQNHKIYTGDGWSYDGTDKVLTLAPQSHTTYDLKDYGSIRKDYNSIACSTIIEKNATIVNGSFLDIKNPGSSITNYGTITSGGYDMPVVNHGTITGGMFNSTVTNTGTIKGGIFHKKPENGQVADGYTLKVNSQQNGSYESYDAEISYFGNSGYVIPNSDHDTSITIYISLKNSQAVLFPIDVTFGDSNDTHCLLEDWAPNASHHDDGMGSFSVTFTAPPAKADTVTLSKLTRLVIDENGYPVGTEGGTQDYSGNGWSYNHTDKTLTLNPSTPTSYDFSGEGNALNPAVQLEVKSGATLTGGAFAKKPKGAGTFKTVTLNGTDSITAVNGLASGDWGNTLYVVKTGYNTITASEPIRDINRILLKNDDPIYPPDSSNKKTVCINIQQFLNSVSALDPEADITLNQASHGLSLIMASDGTPVIVNAPFKPDGNFYNYCGNGWHYQALSGDPGHVYLESGNYNFLYTDPVNKKGENLRSVNCGIVNEGSTIEDGIFNALVANGQPGSTSSEPPKIEGGTFAAGLLYNDGVITGGAFNGKDSILPIGIGLSGNYRSVTVKDGAIVKVNDTLPLVYNETTYDLVQGSAWDLYSYAGTVLTVKADADITNINGQEIGKAFNSIYPNGETNKKVVRFEMPDSDVELNSTKIVDPDPKPEPKPEPEPEAPTYTLTVKGGTFTYNGGEAMTSASVPVDAEVKVTLNQSAVPEGMVFDLWAMDEASLLGNPAVAYNEESFTIPAGSVAKGSTVTVEAQYRDATIESEPSVLGTAAIIGVAGAGTAVIVWQGYRIGMELYEKYFQPTPEETAAEQPAPEAPAAAAS